MGLIEIPGRGSNAQFTAQSVQQMDLNQVVGILNDLTVKNESQRQEIVYLKSIVETAKSFAEEMIQMGQTVLDFSNANTMTEGLHDSNPYSQDF